MERFCEDAAESEAQPLSFERLVPEPPDLAERDTCRLPVPAAVAHALEQGEEPSAGETRPVGLIEMLVLEQQEKPVPSERLDWLAWRVHHWGTKWEPVFEVDEIALAISTAPYPDIGDGSPLRLDGQAVFGFLTAWGPPLPLLEAVSHDYPALTFILRYAEPGNDFGGQLKICRRDGLAERTDLAVDEVLAPSERWF